MLPALVPVVKIKEAMKLQKQLHFVDEILKTLEVVMMDAGNSQIAKSAVYPEYFHSDKLTSETHHRL